MARHHFSLLCDPIRAIAVSCTNAADTTRTSNWVWKVCICCKTILYLTFSLAVLCSVDEKSWLRRFFGIILFVKRLIEENFLVFSYITILLVGVLTSPSVVNLMYDFSHPFSSRQVIIIHILYWTDMLASSSSASSCISSSPPHIRMSKEFGRYASASSCLQQSPWIHSPAFFKFVVILSAVLLAARYIYQFPQLSDLIKVSHPQNAFVRFVTDIWITPYDRINSRLFLDCNCMTLAWRLTMYPRSFCSSSRTLRCLWSPSCR